MSCGTLDVTRSAAPVRIPLCQILPAVVWLAKRGAAASSQVAARAPCKPASSPRLRASLRVAKALAIKNGRKVPAAERAAPLPSHMRVRNRAFAVAADQRDQV